MERDLEAWAAAAGGDVTAERHGPPVDGTVDSVLVPVAGGPYGFFAARLAARLADRRRAAVELLTVVPADAGQAARMEADARLRNYAGEFGGVRTEAVVRADDDVTAAIAARTRTRGHDVVVLGATDRSLLRRLVRGTVPDRLADRSDVPVVAVKGDPAATN